MQFSEISYKSPNYPDLLRELSKPPAMLYVRGQLPTGTCVSIVGSRRPTDYGRRVTYQLAYQLARAGIVIVSGLAYGIDTISHQAAVEAGGQTIAVLGTPIDRVYPAGNTSLARQIVSDSGAIISEYPPGFVGHRGVFPQRNRIIAGLARITIVTEAKASSGALITARDALRENRTVMAVPGNTTSQLSAGPNNLIKTGAVPVLDATDVLAELNLHSPAIASAPVRAKSREEATILELLTSGTADTQTLIEQSGLSAQEFANIITLMEITGKVRNLGAGQWVTR